MAGNKTTFGLTLSNRALVTRGTPPKELIEMEHVVLLPHVASGSHYTRRAMCQLVVDNLKSWFAGKGPLTPVVETPWPRKS